MSNLGDYAKTFNSLSAADKAGLEEVGTILGTMADFGGAFSFVAGLVEVFVSLMSSDNNVNAILSAQLDELNANIDNLRAIIRVDELLSRVQTLDALIGPSVTALQQLKSALPPNPPPIDVDQRIGECLTPLNQLNTDSQWRLNYLDQLYYDDGGAWVGKIAPDDPSSSGPWSATLGEEFVFSTRYVLVRYARCLSHLLIVGPALDPKFWENYGVSTGTVGSFIDRLDNACTTALNGIVSLPAPAETEIYRPVWDPDLGTFRVNEIAGVCSGTWAIGRNAVQESIAFSEDWWQLYGTVDSYGGYFAVGNFPGIPAPPLDDAGAAPPNFYSSFLAEHSLRTRATFKEVYTQLGLAEVRKLIGLARFMLTGQKQPEQQTPDPYATWSIREISDVLGSATGGMPPNPSLRQIMTDLNGLSGSYVNSLRVALAIVTPEPTLSFPPGYVSSPDDMN